MNDKKTHMCIPWNIYGIHIGETEYGDDVSSGLSEIQLPYTFSICGESSTDYFSVLGINLIM